MTRPLALCLALAACASDPVTEIDRAVNARMQYADQPARVGPWTVRFADGNCIDFATAKLLALRAIGRDGRIVIYRIAEMNQWHAVVRTDDGWILDNRRPSPRRWVPPATGWHVIDIETVARWRAAAKE